MTATLGAAPGDHVVMFYEDDDVLTNSVADVARDGLAAQADVLILATAPHRRALARLLHPSANPPIDARLTVLDARETLDDLLRGDGLNVDRLLEFVGGWLAAASANGATPRIYGEMVALLWDDGQFGRALQLERVWNVLAASFTFSLLCAYPMRGFGDTSSTVDFYDVCQQHTAVTTESYARLRDGVVGRHPMVVLDNTEPGGRIVPG